MSDYIPTVGETVRVPVRNWPGLNSDLEHWVGEVIEVNHTKCSGTGSAWVELAGIGQAQFPLNVIEPIGAEPEPAKPEFYLRRSSGHHLDYDKEYIGNSVYIDFGPSYVRLHITPNGRLRIRHSQLNDAPALLARNVSSNVLDVFAMDDEHLIGPGGGG